MRQILFRSHNIYSVYNTLYTPISMFDGSFRSQSLRVYDWR